MHALKQWVKINVQKSFTIESLKMLLAKKFDYNFEHITMRAFAPADKSSNKKERLQLPTKQPLQTISYFKGQ